MLRNCQLITFRADDLSTEKLFNRTTTPFVSCSCSLEPEVIPWADSSFADDPNSNQSSTAGLFSSGYS